MRAGRSETDIEDRAGGEGEQDVGDAASAVALTTPGEGPNEAIMAITACLGKLQAVPASPP